MGDIPSGIVSFLFTDIEDSTRSWETDPDGMDRSLVQHDQIIKTLLEEHHGHLFATGGDGFAVAFAAPAGALRTAVAIQQRLTATLWDGPELTIRIGVHTGAAQERDGDFFGPVPNRAARIMALASGGEILVSRVTAEMCSDWPDLAALLEDVGEHHLQGLHRPERIYRVAHHSESSGGQETEEDPVGRAVRSEAPSSSRVIESDRPETLVERDELIGELDSIITGSSRGGHVVLLAGRAGEGKSAVVRAVMTGKKGRVWFGACDALSTPRPLGPIHDVGTDDPAVAALVDDSPATFDLFSGLLSRLSAAPHLVIIEDVHWADETTLDLLVYLGRRMHTTRSTLIVTYRHDEVGVGDPLSRVLGELARAQRSRRMILEPLSRAGVATIAAGHGRDPDRLHEVTGGNPFHLTEVLAAPGWSVPPTVSDAVNARAGRLSEGVLDVLRTASVEPGPSERQMLEALGHAPGAIGDALASGMVVAAGAAVVFRHELARLAILETIDHVRLVDLHRRVLDTLVARGSRDLARIAHHAIGSLDDDAIVEWATRAGAQSSENRAHRQAAEFYRYAVDAAERRMEEEAGTIDELVSNLERLARELSTTDHQVARRSAEMRILELASTTEDRARALSSLALGEWAAGEGEQSRAHISDALRLLPEMDSPEISASVLTDAGYLAMLGRRGDEALEQVGRAIPIAERHGLREVLMRAFNARGSVRLGMFADPSGVEDLETSARIADELGHDNAVASAHVNIGSGAGEVRLYELALPALDHAIALSEVRDLDTNRAYASAWKARVLFERGHWSEAESLAEAFSSSGQDVAPMTPITSLAVLGRIRARRGEPVAEALTRAWELALRTGDLQRLWPVLAGRAEQAWLGRAPDPDLETDLASTYRMAADVDLGWAVGELGFWAHRFEIVDDVPDSAAPAFRHHVRGRYREAAEAWRTLGCPYEEAWALAESGDETEMRSALEMLNGLGARPLADRVRRHLRELGAVDIPAGPRTITTEHPAGLTPRQAEVLTHLVAGRSDREIAEILFITPKTVGHHVSAVLRKLDVDTRTAAAVVALTEGWAPTPS